MEPSPYVKVVVDLSQVRASAERIARATGVDLIAVVKSDAYGLGAARVCEAIADVAAGFYVQNLTEAVRDRIAQRTGRPVTALLGESSDPQDYISHGVRPCVWDIGRAAALRAARPVLSVDTGQQRFACTPEQVAAVIRAGGTGEAMTHAARIEQIERFVAAMAGQGVDRLHAAGSSLLGEPSAWLSAVRPGLALYRQALRVSAHIVEARNSAGPAGYSGFVVPRHGVILAGYSHGLRPGPCQINGQRQRILEVGMQTSFVELAPQDRVGDEVLLLGDELTPESIAASWGTTPHEVLVHLSAAGQRGYEA